jgi:type 1 glutamine amidotransferase
VRLSCIFAAGAREELVLKDGERFADWIARHDVPGSEWVDLLEPESPGQVRRFTLDPSRPDVPIAAIELASLDNHLSPTFLALTAQLRGAAASAPVPAPFVPPTEVRHLIFGGGTSHDYPRWFQAEDLRTLAATGAAQRFAYSELSEHLTRFLPQLEALTLCNNQALAGAELRKALFDFVDAGGGLCLLHAATWYNWPDWPEYNRNLVGGGARSHEPYAELRVTVIDPDHPLMRGVAAAFTVADELYRFEADPVGAPLHVLATATSATTGATYPVAWTVERGGGRVFATTLGHDGAAHAHRDFQTLLRNAAHWLAAR